jgi:hypothetical protein
MPFLPERDLSGNKTLHDKVLLSLIFALCTFACDGSNSLQRTGGSAMTVSITWSIPQGTSFAPVAVNLSGETDSPQTRSGLITCFTSDSPSNCKSVSVFATSFAYTLGSSGMWITMA